MKYIDKNSEASDPVNIFISHKKLKALRPDLYGFEGLFKKKIKNKLKEHIYYGDSQPAVVISTKPLLIAAYSDELDCIAMLRYPQHYVEEYKLMEKSRLLTINIYIQIPPCQKDLILGDNILDNWYGFHPIIAEFISEDIQRIERRKQMIQKDIWEYVYNLGTEYRALNSKIWRDGRMIY